MKFSLYLICFACGEENTFDTWEADDSNIVRHNCVHCGMQNACLLYPGLRENIEWANNVETLRDSLREKIFKPVPDGT